MGAVQINFISRIWVFIAQLLEHCSTNAEAMGSNPIEAMKIFFWQKKWNCLNCHCNSELRWSHLSFINILCIKQNKIAVVVTISLTGKRPSTILFCLILLILNVEIMNMHACTFSSPTHTSPPDESNSMDLTPADTLALPPYTTSDKHITCGPITIITNILTAIP